MNPLEFLEKLVALVLPPKIHLIRYHGCLAPHSTLRSRIVPKPADEKEDEPERLSEHEDSRYHGSRPYRISWAKILSRVFLTDFEHCEKCGGKMKIILIDRSALLPDFHACNLRQEPRNVPESVSSYPYALRRAHPPLENRPLFSLCAHGIPAAARSPHRPNHGKVCLSLLTPKRSTPYTKQVFSLNQR